MDSNNIAGGAMAQQEAPAYAERAAEEEPLAYWAQQMKVGGLVGSVIHGMKRGYHVAGLVHTHDGYVWAMMVKDKK